MVQSKAGSLRTRSFQADIPVNKCPGKYGNFWGTSPYSPQELERMNLEKQKQNALVGEAPRSSISAVSFVSNKSAKRNAAGNGTKLRSKSKRSQGKPS